MLTQLFTAYLNSERTTISENELKQLISRAYPIINSILKIKYKSENYNIKQIEEEAIEIATILFRRNGKEKILLFEKIGNNRSEIKNESDLKYLFFRTIKEQILFNKPK